MEARSQEEEDTTPEGMLEASVNVSVGLNMVGTHSAEGKAHGRARDGRQEAPGILAR